MIGNRVQFVAINIAQLVLTRELMAIFDGDVDQVFSLIRRDDFNSIKIVCVMFLDILRISRNITQWINKRFTTKLC